jgi:hypothetical protein
MLRARAHPTPPAGRFLTGLAAALAAVGPLSAQATPAAVVTGSVRDAGTSAPLLQARVSIEGTLVTTTTDAQGRYRLDAVPSGPQVLRVIRIGYAPVRRPLIIPNTGTLTFDVTMAGSALSLPGIIVVADPLSRAKGELGTASVIEGEAIRNQTAASLQGLLELVPGVPLGPPGLDGVQQFSLRSVPISAGASGGGPGAFQPTAETLASFGTQIVVDGVPVSNNNNLQSLGSRGELSITSSAGGGIDLRRIPASTIERVEVIRGVPSARFGDLTQGAVLVDMRAGSIPPELLVRLDARTVEATMVGGSGFGGGQTASGSFDVARTRLAPGQTDDQSYRFAGQAAHRFERGSLRLDTRVDAFQLVEDRPESPVFPGTESSSRDNGIRISERARITLGRTSRLELTGAFDVNRQRSFSRQPKLRAAQPFTNRLTEGRQIGKFIGGSYNARVDVDGDPRNLYNRLELIAAPGWLSRDESFRLGAELRREWNAGPGVQFDIEFPPQTNFNGVNGFDRPRRFDLIPAIATTALYADERATWNLGASATLAVQGGARLDVLHRGGTWFSAARDKVLQPRINVELAPARWIRLRAGAGRLAKIPTLESLYPGVQYYDLVNVNYFANNPAERLAVITTRIVDRTNPELGYSVADKMEAGLEAEPARGVQIAFTTFHDRTKGAVGVFNQPTFFLREHFRIVDSTIGTGRPPDFEVPAFSTDSVPVLIDRPDNNLTFTSSGVELTASLPPIPGINTSVAIQGAYTKTRVDNRNIEFNPNFFVFQISSTAQAARTPYYDGATRTGERMLLTTRLIHQRPEAGLVITATVQFNLRERSQDIAGTDTLSFAGYLTRTGVLVPVAPADRTDPQYQDLRQPRLGLFVVPQKSPSDWIASIQVAKTLPAGGRLSFYAFNFLDRIGKYGDRFTNTRLFPAARFGLEVTMPVAVWK